MFNGHHLTALMERDSLSVKEIVQKFGWSSNRQYYQFLAGNPTAKTLELVADYFHVPVDYFFDRTADVEDGPALPVKEPCGTLLYERLLSEKDKRIETLEKLLAIYEHDARGTK